MVIKLKMECRGRLKAQPSLSMETSVGKFDRLHPWFLSTVILPLVLLVPLENAGAAPAALLTRDQIIAEMKPYAGPHRSAVNPDTLKGKVLCGYQGWFCTPTDGSGRGWYHYQNGGRFEPGHCCIDFWPDVSELEPQEKYQTAFRHTDGSAASVFSSQNRQTVMRHFQWMRDYGIDGVFVHRFPTEVDPAKNLSGWQQFNKVLSNCQAGANQYGRAWALRYEFPVNLKPGDLRRVVLEDWKLLVDRMEIRKDKAYLHHNGKPVVYLWGIGIKDERKYDLDECAELIAFLKNDPHYGGNFVILGTPYHWRTGDGDAISDPKFIALLKEADMVNPWTPGRYATSEEVIKQADTRWQPDSAWCQEHALAFAPTVFPGFSWHNMFPQSPMPLIPRNKGQFFWTQFVAAHRIGAAMVYVAMFDEMNEGTAIFKCTDHPPVGASRFMDLEGLPSDYYLWLAGQGGRLLRGEIEATERPPVRNR